MSTNLSALIFVCFVFGISANPTPSPELVNFPSIPSIANQYYSVEGIDEIKSWPFNNFSQITNRMYHTSVGAINGSNLIKHNIGCVFDVQIEFNYTIPGDSIKHYEFKYVKDLPDSDLTPFLDDAVEKMHKCDNEGKNFVVHCVAGSSRSGSVVVAYLIKHENMTLRDAFIHSRTQRKVAQPNNGFFKQLINYEQKIRGNTTAKMVQLKRDDLTIEAPDVYEKFPDLINEMFEEERKRREKQTAAKSS